MRTSLPRSMMVFLVIGFALSATSVFPQPGKDPPPNLPPLAVPDGGRPPFALPPAMPPIAVKASEPEVRYLKTHETEIEYQVGRVGPSGVGAMQIWITKDDGKTWTAHSAIKGPPDEQLAQSGTRKLVLSDEADKPLPDGRYGLSLAVKNRAGVGRSPKAGDAPQLRFVIDTRAPEVQLLKPVADPQRPGQVLLKWTAVDDNLADALIEVSYSDKREGPWLELIKFQDKKVGASEKSVSGQFSFVSELKTPVYLRLRVRDKAGNDGIAVTQEPEWLDFTEPEGILTKIRAK